MSNYSYKMYITKRQTMDKLVKNIKLKRDIIKYINYSNMFGGIPIQYNSDEDRVFHNPTFYAFRLKSIGLTTHHIILEKQFIIDKMNTVTHRLLGLSTDDDLTTTSPTRDSSGAYLILEILGISWENFNQLVYFLRTNRLNKEFHDAAMNAAIALGGFPELDKYIINERKVVYNPPRSPQDDIKNEYEWSIISSLNDNLILETHNKGYICTGTMTHHNNVPYLYYRKKLI